MQSQIAIVGSTFEPDGLNELVACLQDAGYRWAVFESLEAIRPALAKSSSALLFVGTSAVDQRSFLEAMRAFRTSNENVSIVLSLDARALPATDILSELQVDDFVVAPLNPYDVRLRVERLILPSGERSGDQLEQVRQNLLSHFATREFVGKAPAFLAVIEKIPRVAVCDATVLLTGETGTGKEMCARAIHYVSARASGPFVPVDCGSIPTELFENELFGHESGAFTDARRGRSGLIDEAQGGTLFLDEVDSLIPPAQVKLLRLLQDRQYKPLGASRYRQAEIRIIAASNQDLHRKTREGTFREDLYYRLLVLSLCLPALRDRREDIILLALHFLKTAAREYNRAVSRFSSDAIRKLTSYSWPGNVRELENVVRQSVVLASEPVIHADGITQVQDWPISADSQRQSFKMAKARMVENFERSYLSDVLAACGGNISRAASEAKKNRRAFFGLLKKHGLTQAAARRAAR